MATAYLPFLIARGIKVELSSDGTTFSAGPKEKITETLRKQIVRYRAQILTELQQIASGKTVESIVDEAKAVNNLMPVDLEELQSTADPRPDLEKDHPLWELVLTSIREENPKLHGLLYGFRAWGARITKGLSGRLVIDYTPKEGWDSRSGFQQDYEKWLRPFDDALMGLLRRVEVPGGTSV
jgi:hypothetical protein